MSAPEAQAAFVPPKIIKRFSHAAAGHEGVLRDESGALLIKPCLPKEIAFYESSKALHPEFAKWMPTFMGTLNLSKEQDATDLANVLQAEKKTTTQIIDTPDTEVKIQTTTATAKKPLEQSIVLSNLAYGFSKPCVLDVKLGAQLWDDNAPQEKRDRLDAVAYKTTSGSLGMRIAGMKVWKGTDYQVYDKNYGRTFDTTTAIDGFMEYFSGSISKDHAKILSTRFANKVNEVQKVLENQESRMYSASLLFVYEGDDKILTKALEHDKIVKQREERDEEDDDDEESDDEVVMGKKVEDMKLIDFAHADWTPGKGADENALKGVRSVAKLLQQVSESIQ